VLCYAANTTSMDPIAFANLVGSFLEAARAVRDQFAEPLRVAAPAAGELPFGEALRI